MKTKTWLKLSDHPPLLDDLGWIMRPITGLVGVAALFSLLGPGRESVRALSNSQAAKRAVRQSGKRAGESPST